MSYDRTLVARRLKSLRAEKGMQQSDLSRVSGVSVSSITRYETEAHDMGLDVAYALTEALGCTLDQLVGRK